MPFRKRELPVSPALYRAKMEGREEGKEKGIVVGIEIGREQGVEETTKTIAIKLINQGTAIEIIKAVTGLSVAAIDDLVKSVS